MNIIREVNIGQFRGNFPDVPIAAGVDLDALKETDASPFFVTLPIVPSVGAVSKNGLLYDDALVSSIEEQINSKRPGALFGHLKDSERDTAYPIPEGMWVGAKRVAETLWAKAYIPPGAAREHVKRLKAVGGAIATSIYGQGTSESAGKGVRRLIEFKLESLDFADPARAALGMGAQPHVTAEMETEQESEMDREQVIATLTARDLPAALRESIIAEHVQATGQQTRVSELAEQVKERDDRLRVLETSVAEYRRKETALAIDAKVAELTNWQTKDESATQTLASLRRMLKRLIVAEMSDSTTPDAIGEIAARVWADNQAVAESVRDALAGPSAIVGGKLRSGSRPELTDTPEARAQAHAALGW